MIQKITSLINGYITGENISLVLFFIGMYGLSARKNVIKSIIGLSIMQAAIILFFVTIHANTDSVPPIGTSFNGMPADPLPHALMITAIVVGMAVTAVSLTMFITLYHKYGTTNWNKVKNKRRDIEL